jgi:hypothetical protein
MPEETAGAVETHLRVCPKCCKALPTIHAEDYLTTGFRAGGCRPQPHNDVFDRLADDIHGRLLGLALYRDATASCESDATPTPAGAVAEVDVRSLLALPQQPDELGRLGDYRVLKVLESGGMGVVFLAEDTRLRRRVAVKAMRPTLAANDKARQRFLREAQLTAVLTHDHIVPVHHVGEEKGVPFVAMPLLQGESLDTRLKRQGRLPLVETVQIGRETAEGLAAAHAHGLIHRDIKPGNLWLETLSGESGVSGLKYRIKILDFGLARCGDDDPHLTRTGEVLGTPAYMSPEQARGEKVDARGDLFSLGCVLYKLCTGQTPFPGDTAVAVLTALAVQQPRPLRALNPDVPPELSDLVMRLLQKDPRRRPASAQEVVRKLQALEKQLVEKHHVTEATHVTVGDRVVARAGRGRRFLLAGALVAALAGVLLYLTVIRDGTPRNTDIQNQDLGKPVSPKDDAWIQLVAGLPYQKQLEAVAAKLKELNPGFDGKLTPFGDKDGVSIVTDKVTIIRPLSALTGLRGIVCQGSAPGKGRLTDLSGLKDTKLKSVHWFNTPAANLSSLKGLKLDQLVCNDSKVADLLTLKEMPLSHLTVQNTEVASLLPLADMKLRFLDCSGTKVTDLSPVSRLPLQFLYCRNTGVRDLKPLAGLRFLTYLDCRSTLVTDLSPLKGLRLSHLDCRDTKVTTLAPLRGMALKILFCDFEKERDSDVLRSLGKLERINGQSAKEFWKQIDGK